MRLLFHSVLLSYSLCMAGLYSAIVLAEEQSGVSPVVTIAPVTSKPPSTNHVPAERTDGHRATDNPRQHAFVYCGSALVNTFNPQKASNGLTVDTLSSQIYERLLSVDPVSYQLKPELAVRWKILNNGATYRFYLRPQVAFQTTSWFTPSRSLNADDVLFSFRRVYDITDPWHHINNNRYPYFDSLQFANTIKDIRKIDDYTIEFQLYQPDSSFLWHLATHYAPILSAEYAAQLAHQQHQSQIDYRPVGSGPFALQEYRSGQFIRLTRHNQYWRGQPAMQQVVIDLTSGGTGRISKLLSGECDVLAWPAASQLSVLRHDTRLRVATRSGMNISYLAFNTKKPPLNNPQVRHALALSINNPRLMESIYYGTAETAASVLPRASWAYDNNAKVTPYDPKQSQQRLQALGIQNLTLQLAVPIGSFPWNPSPLKTAALIKADMARVNVNVVIVPVESPRQQQQLLSNNIDLILTGWATDSNDPDSFFRPLLSCAASRSGNNYARWCDEDFSNALQQGRQSQQLAGRITAYLDAQHILAEALPVLPLASSLRILVYRADIKGLVVSPFGNSSFAGVARSNVEDINSKNPAPGSNNVKNKNTKNTDSNYTGSDIKRGVMP